MSRSLCTPTLDWDLRDRATRKIRATARGSRDIAFRYGQASVHVDAISFHPADRIGAAIPNQDLPILPSRGLVDERAQFAIIESLIAFNHCRNLSDLYRRLLLRIRLNLENVDRVPPLCKESGRC